MLAKYNIELIGAKLPSIDRAEDRELFKQSMQRIGLKVPLSGENQARLQCMLHITSMYVCMHEGDL